MKEETRLAKEAEERGEESAPPEIVSETPPSTLGEAVRVSASDLVGEDTDRPIADNKLPPSDGMDSVDIDAGDATPNPTGGNVNPPEEKKKRGRKPMTPEEKARAKIARLSKGLPDFSGLPGAGGKVGGSSSVGSDRDYYNEACNIFIPSSMLLGKALGEHWAVPIVDKTINGLPQKVLEPTDEQKQYLANMARWLQYEQFPEVNPRWAFVIASLGYAAPKIKTDPTPEKLKAGWEWFKVKILRRSPTLKE